MTTIPDPTSIPPLDDVTAEGARTPLARRLAREAMCLTELNRARLTQTRRLRRRERTLRAVYRSNPNGTDLVRLAATVLVLRERGWRVQADGTTEQVLEAVLVVSRRYRYSVDPESRVP